MPALLTQISRCRRRLRPAVSASAMIDCPRRSTSTRDADGALAEFLSQLGGRSLSRPASSTSPIRTIARACLRQPAGDRLADAARRTRHDRDPAFRGRSSS